MKKLWSAENKFNIWFRVELAAMKALEQHGILSKGAAQALEKKVKKIDPERIDQLEAVSRHDVIAFLAYIEELAGESSSFMHFGMTSSDILDTALALQLTQASDLIIKELKELIKALKKRAVQYKTTPMIGRTHGIHAQPISLGLVFAIWYQEMKRNLQRIKSARMEIAHGKLSGAVGIYQQLSPEIEETSMKLLGLKPEPVSNQIVQRDRHAAFFSTLAVCGASIEKIALNIRHWQRTEVAEVFESFRKGQKGSSAMPHKRNPIISENLCGLSRLLRANALASLENVALWHERDISHSSVERVIGPDSTTLLHFMLRRMTRMINGLQVNKEKMLVNLNLTGGVVFSEAVMNHLIRSGLRRQEAYELVQRCALKSLRGKDSFRSLLLKDKEITKRIGKKKIVDSFDPKFSLKHVSAIYRRILKDEK